MRVIALLALVAAPLAAEDDPADVLIRLRDQVVAHGEHIPNYTCVETVQRERYESTVPTAPKSCDALLARRKQENFPATLRHATTDRLRLDVAMAEAGEIYSWAGAPRFEEGEIDELIPDGAMGTGPFAAMLLSVFRGRAPKFLYDGETMLDRRRVFEYSFRVPLEESRYRVRAGRDWVITAYTGTLWVDPATAELVRLMVRTDELPEASHTCETQTMLDYALVQLGKSDYLLPKETRQRFIGRDGAEGENAISFASCREYRGQSTVRFGERAAAGSEAKDAGEAPEAAFPAGLPVTIDVVSAVRSDRAAAGDRIEGRLAAAIRDRDGRVLAPEGAAAEGRLMRVEIRHGRGAGVVIALRWETIERNGVKTGLSLLPNRKTADLKVGETSRLGRRGIEIELPMPADSRYRVYHFPGEYAFLESGYRTEWKTAAK